MRNYHFNHLLYVDDLKRYANKRERLYRIIEVVKSLSKDIQMEFGLDKCKMIHLVRGQLDIRGEGCAVDQNQIIENLQYGESYKYLGFLQSKGIGHTLIKKCLTNQFKARLNGILKSSLSGGNKCKAINTWATPLLTYSFGVIK